MGFGTFSILDATKNLQLFFTVFDGLLGIFGSLALTVASLGIINTLVMAILERRREIGILKALGAADRDVRRLFFAEAGAMGLCGGIFGVLLGWLIGRAVTFGTNTYLARQQLPPDRLVLRASVDDRRGDCVFLCGEPGGGNISRRARRKTQSRRGAQV